LFPQTRLIQNLTLQTLCPIGTSLALYTEPGNELDYYGRYLAYVILPDGACLNDILIREGYAKATRNYFCNALPQYQLENWQARRKKRGLYKTAKHF
jgi:micrococcal nuclease